MTPKRALGSDLAIPRHDPCAVAVSCAIDADQGLLRLAAGTAGSICWCTDARCLKGFTWAEKNMFTCAQMHHKHPVCCSGAQGAIQWFSGAASGTRLRWVGRCVCMMREFILRIVGKRSLDKHGPWCASCIFSSGRRAASFTFLPSYLV